MSWRNVIVGLFALSALLGLASCRDSDRENLERMTEDLKDTFYESIESIERRTKESEISRMSQEQVSNLFTIEYKVFDFPEELDQPQVETALTRAGQERWDCFAVAKTFSGTRVYCKRRPQSVLRYFPILSSLF